MVQAISNHSLVIVQSKLFAVGPGKHRCEVFDATANKFAVVKSSQSRVLMEFSLNQPAAVSVVNKIFASGLRFRPVFFMIRTAVNVTISLRTFKVFFIDLKWFLKIIYNV